MNYKTIQEVVDNLNANRYRIQRNVSKNFGVHNRENFLAELRNFQPMMVAYDHRLNVFTVTCSNDPDTLSTSETLLASAATIRTAFSLAEYYHDREALEVFRLSIRHGLQRALARLGKGFEKTDGLTDVELVKSLRARLTIGAHCD